MSIKDVRFMLSKWLKALTLGKCVSVCVRYNSVRMWKYSLSFETYMLFKPKYQVYIHFFFIRNYFIRNRALILAKT